MTTPYTPTNTPTRPGVLPTIPSGGGGLANEIKRTLTNMEHLKVVELKALCKSLQLSTGGKKAQLQTRIADFIKRSMYLNVVDPWRPKAINALILRLHSQVGPLPSYFDMWEAIKRGIQNPESAPIPTGIGTASLGVTGLPPPAQSVPSTSHVRPTTGVTNKGPTEKYIPSVFYNVMYSVPNTSILLPRNEQKGRGIARFKFNKQVCYNGNTMTNNRLYLFCREVKASTSQYFEVKFPFLNEIMMNGKKITDNVRGIKNQNGTAKPADMTQYLLDSGSNNIEIIFAQTTSKYIASCFVVQIKSPEELLQEIIHKRPKIKTDVTLAFIKETLDAESDDDFVTTSMVLSLQCPISYTKMRYPARSIDCKHLQCFDALWYLHSQQQVPTWSCPICSKKAPYENLRISEYVETIVQKTNDDIEQVQINRDGSWIPFNDDEPLGNNENENNNNDKNVKEESNTSIGGITNAGPAQMHGADTNVISLDSSDEEEEEPATNQYSGNQGNDNNANADTNVNIGTNTHTEKTPTENESEVDSDVPLSEQNTIQASQHGYNANMNNVSSNNNNNNNNNPFVTNPAVRIPPATTTVNNVTNNTNNNNTNFTRSIPRPTSLTSNSDQIAYAIASAAALANARAKAKTDADEAKAREKANREANGRAKEFVSGNPNPVTNPSSVIDSNNSNPSGNSGSNQTTEVLRTNTQLANGNKSPDGDNNIEPHKENTTSSNNDSSNILGLTGSFSTFNRSLFSNKETANVTNKATNSTEKRDVNKRRTHNNVVSPFIPRKPYPPSIPRKRPNDNNNNNIDKTNKIINNSSNNLGVEMGEPGSITRNAPDNDMEIIDLTSDD
mgnify:CR=1 FL=1